MAEMTVDASSETTSLDPHQLLAAGVRQLLTKAGLSFLETLEHTGEPWFKFILETPPVFALEVAVYVAFDQFQFVANGADLRVGLAGFNEGDESGWVQKCLTTLDLLLRNELRIRVRRTPILRRQTGAIWVPPGLTHVGSWSGDLKACLGSGFEFVFLHPWFKTLT